MTSIGHPLLGDEVYGSGKNPYHLQGQTLHAMILGFVHPSTGKYMEFTAPLPEYFLKLLEKIAKIVCISAKVLYNISIESITEGSVDYEQYKFNYYNRS